MVCSDVSSNVPSSEVHVMGFDDGDGYESSEADVHTLNVWNRE